MLCPWVSSIWQYSFQPHFKVVMKSLISGALKYLIYCINSFSEYLPLVF